MSDPSDEQLDETHAAITQAAKKRQRNSSIITVLVAVAAIMVSASAVLSAWSLSEIQKLNRRALEDRRIILLGTECIVAEMAAHRHLNAIGHRANAAHEGYSYPIPPGEEPPPVPGKLEQACATFISTTTSTSKP